MTWATVAFLPWPGPSFSLPRAQFKTRDLAVLLLVNGLFSAAFGAAYRQLLLHYLDSGDSRALRHDPLEGDPMALMLWAISWGLSPKECRRRTPDRGGRLAGPECAL